MEVPFELTGACAWVVDRCPGPFLRSEPSVIQMDGVLRTIDINVTAEIGGGPVELLVSVGSWIEEECGAATCSKTWHGKLVTRAQGMPPFRVWVADIPYDEWAAEAVLHVAAGADNQTSYTVVREGLLSGHLLVERMPDEASSGTAPGRPRDSDGAVLSGRHPSSWIAS